MEELKPNNKRATIAIVVIWITMISEIFFFVSSYFEYRLLQNIATNSDVSEEVINANDDRQQIILIACSIIQVISVVTFIRWFRRAYYNLHLKVKSLSFSEGWAAGSWFVPIIFFFRPYQIMQELYQETKTLLLKKNVIIGKERTLDYISFWWGLWIIIFLISQIELFYLFEEETVEEILSTAIIDMVCGVLSIPLGLITIKIIRDYNTLEALLINSDE